MEFVYCVVRTESLNMIQIDFIFIKRFTIECKHEALKFHFTFVSIRNYFAMISSVPKGLLPLKHKPEDRKLHKI